MSEKIAVKTSEIDRSDDVDLGRLLGTMLDNRWLIISVTTIFTVLGILYVLMATPIYRADALIQVEQDAGDSLLKDVSSMLPDAKPQSAAEIELIKSRMVIGKTVQDLSLDTEVEQKYFPGIGKGFARILNQKSGNIAISRLQVPGMVMNKVLTLEVLDSGRYRLTDSDGRVDITGKVGQLESRDRVSILVSDIEAPAGTEFNVRKLDELTAINKTLNALAVADKGKDTGVLSLTLEGVDPEQTQKILNSIADNYLQQNVERKSAEAAKSLEFLKGQLPIVRTSLDEAENKLNLFRQQNDSVDLTLEAKSVLDTMVGVES
ncbi:Wzz/FepE/Etk N-terminal domain-containing protein, partial [Lonsdalea populi]